MTTWEGEKRVGEKCQAERREALKLTAWCDIDVVCSSGSLQSVQSGQTWSNWLKIHLRGLDEWSWCKKQGGSLPGGIEEVEPGQVFHIRYQLKWGWAAPQLPGEHQDLCMGHSGSNSNCTSRFFPLLNIFFLDSHNPWVFHCHSYCSNCYDLFCFFNRATFPFVSGLLHMLFHLLKTLFLLLSDSLTPINSFKVSA